jgi:branched-chain amino acid transport system substrate-binding protein
MVGIDRYGGSVNRLGTTSRRGFLVGAGAGTFTLLSGCTSDDSDSQGSSDNSGDTNDDGSGGQTSSGGEDQTITIAFVMDFSGPYSTVAQSMLNGFNLRINEQLEGQIDGKEVEYVKRDTELSPERGASIAQDVSQDNEINFIIGPIASSVTGAMMPVISGSDSEQIWFNLSSAVSNYEECHPYFFGGSATTWHMSAPFAPWVLNNIGENISFVYYDYAYGRQLKSGFEEGMGDRGTIVKDIAADPGSTDFSAQIQQLQGSDTDAVFVGLPGSGGVSFANSFDDFGLKEEMTMVAAGTVFSEANISSMGESGMGAYSYYPWTLEQETDRNEEFKDNFAQAYDRVPNGNSAYGYAGASTFETAIKEGGLDDPDAMVDTLETAENIDFPGGDWVFNEQNHSVVVDMHVREGEKIDGEVHNSVVRVDEKINLDKVQCE